MVPDCYIKNLGDFKGTKKSFKWAKKQKKSINKTKNKSLFIGGKKCILFGGPVCKYNYYIFIWVGSLE